MKRVFAGLLAFLLMLSCCACDSDEDQGTDSIVAAYLEKTQEFIDAGDLDSAVAVLEEGINNTNAPELMELLAQVQKNIEEQSTEPTEETLPVQDLSSYLGLWANDKCRMELTASRDVLYVNMKCLSYRVLEYELDMSANISEQEQGKVRLAFEDDGYGNSGTIILYLDDDVINYVISDYVAVSENGIQAGYGGGSLTRVTDGMELPEIEPAQTEAVTEPAPETEATMPTEPAPPTDPPQQSAGGSEYIGTWQDTWSQRAHMVIKKNGSYYDITITWPNGANENYVWRMWAVDAEGGSLFSDYCEKSIEYFDEYGNGSTEVVYSGGHVTIYIYDGYLYWNDYTEDAGRQCCFEKTSR